MVKRATNSVQVHAAHKNAYDTLHLIEILFIEKDLMKHSGFKCVKPDEQYYVRISIGTSHYIFQL